MNKSIREQPDPSEAMSASVAREQSPVAGAPIKSTNGPPNPTAPTKQGSVKRFGVCPTCGLTMTPEGRKDTHTELWPKWNCRVHGVFAQDAVKHCVRYIPNREIINLKGRVRQPGKLTSEILDLQTDSRNREKELRELMKEKVDYTPSQKTSMSADQCRFGEDLFRVIIRHGLDVELALNTTTNYFAKHSVEDMMLVMDIMAAGQGCVTLSEMLEFVCAFKQSGIKCTAAGLVGYAKTTKWPGDKGEKVSLIDALLRVIEFKRNKVSPERLDHLLVAAYYIAGHFQRNPLEYVDPAVLTDHAVKEWCLYDYSEDLEKWERECNIINALNKIAAEKGQPLQPLPAKPQEMIDYRYKPHPDKKGIFFTVRCERPRPWTYEQAKTMITEVRHFKKIMSSPTLDGVPAGWCQPPGQDLLMEEGGVWGERKKEQMAQRMLTNRVLTTEEKQRCLDGSLIIDQGRGAASALFQGWGGGRREDIEKYCEENFIWQDGQIRINENQNKNDSRKMVTALLNFYYMAFFLMKTNRWSTTFLKEGFMPTTRMRILAWVGFWEESWADHLSLADQMPCEDFAYAPFDPALDFPDIGRLVQFLRKPSFTGTLILRGIPPKDVELIQKCSINNKEVPKIIACRLNDLMNGQSIFDPSLFPDLDRQLRDRAKHMMEKSKSTGISGANLKCLNRWLLEDILPGLVSTRQNYPKNGLRRSGLTAHFLLFEDADRSANYFSTGKRSVEFVYKCFQDKKYSREHWTVGYTAMAKSLGENRERLLPFGHKLDEFRNSHVIATEQRIADDADVFNQAAKDMPVRRKGYSSKAPKFTQEERQQIVDEYIRRIKAGDKINQDDFAKEKGMGKSTLTDMLQAVGFRQQRSEEDIQKLLREFEQAAKDGISMTQFAKKRGVPYNTLYRYLSDAGKTKEVRHRTPEEIAKLLDELAKSGMSQREFAAKIGVSEVTIASWKKGVRNVAEGEKNEGVNHIHRTPEQIEWMIKDFKACKLEDKELSAKKYAERRGIPYSTVRKHFSKADLLQETNRHTAPQIIEHVRKFKELRETDPAITREEYAGRIGVTVQTLHSWMSDHFQKLLAHGLNAKV